MSYKWQQSEFNYIYYRIEDGKIVGLAHRLGNQGDIYIAKIYQNNIDNIIGQYVSMDFARGAVEHKVLEMTRTLLENES